MKKSNLWLWLITIILVTFVIISYFSSSSSSESYEVVHKRCYNARSNAMEWVDVQNGDCTSAGCNFLNGGYPTGSTLATCCRAQDGKTEVVRTNGVPCSCYNPIYKEVGSLGCEQADVAYWQGKRSEIQKQIEEEKRQQEALSVLNKTCWNDPNAAGCGGTPPPTRLMYDPTQPYDPNQGVVFPTVEYGVNLGLIRPNVKFVGSVKFFPQKQANVFMSMHGEISLWEYEDTPRKELAFIDTKFLCNDPYYPTEIRLLKAPASFGNILKINWNADQSAITVTNPKTSQSWTLPLQFDTNDSKPFILPPPTPPPKKGSFELCKVSQDCESNRCFKFLGFGPFCWP